MDHRRLKEPTASLSQQRFDDVASAEIVCPGCARASASVVQHSEILLRVRDETHVERERRRSRICVLLVCEILIDA